MNVSRECVNNESSIDECANSASVIKEYAISESVFGENTVSEKIVSAKPVSENTISVEQFVSEVMEQYGVKTDNEDYISYAYNAGWLEEQDVAGRALPLERKTAVRIIHQFLKLELKELDETAVSAASKLQDLYECRVCAGHVMQVYVKGIMDGHTDNAGRFVFGMNERVSPGETREIIQRLFYQQSRKPQTSANEASLRVQELTEGEALDYMQNNKGTLLIDVRPLHEFEENHLKGAINIPLASVLKNPYAVSERRDIGILLYCQEGYQSHIAAGCLADAGYEKVYPFAWKTMDLFE